MIKVQNVTFGYDREKSILSNFSFEFADKKSYTICGENGRGKTTLIKLILGLLKPESGRIEKENVSVIGYLPDYNGLYEELTLRDNILFRLGIYNIDLGSVEEKLESWSHAYGLTQYMDSCIKELSLGTKKKAALLCTLLTEPDVLVLDEPTGGLDNKAKAEFIKILKEYQEKMTIITVTHDEFYIREFESNCVKL